MVNAAKWQRGIKLARALIVTVITIAAVILASISHWALIMTVLVVALVLGTVLVWISYAIQRRHGVGQR